MSPERIAFINKLRAQNYSPCTLITYEQALVRMATHYNKSPLLLSTNEIQNYIIHLIEVDKFEPATVNLHIGAFKKFFSLLAPDNTVMSAIGKVRSHRKLPAVLTAEEIAKMIQCVKNIKHRAMLELFYSSGIRLSECRDLLISDIDGKNHLVHVTQGKGGKERYTVIGKKALLTLRAYYSEHRPQKYLFEGRNKEKYTKRSIERIIENAAQRAGITKRVSVHTLRHSFATHLLEQNVNLCTIQKLLGHSDVKTTTIYTHVSTATITKIANPLDIAFETTKEALS